MNKKYWIIALIALPFVIAVSKMAGQTAAERVNEREHAARPAAEKAKLRVVASVQSAEGVTPDMWNMDVLKNLENYYIARTTENTKKALAAKGLTNIQVEFTAESVFVLSGSNKLAVTRLKQKSGGRATFITGIVGDELRRVVCASEEDDSIPISYGECGEKIAEVFGRRLVQ